ncbi:unnamed protein product, partial [Ectocarpus fasciculatus]
MSTQSLLQTVKAAIDALDSPQHCHEASAYLVEFEGKAEAWDVAQQLMSEPASTNKRFHGANMFYHKIRHDYSQMADKAPMLQQALIAHLTALAAEPQPDIPVYRRICLSLAALSLQMNEAGVVGDILGKLNSIVATSPRVLLELLTVLPEECYNRHIVVAPRTRHMFSDQLCRSAAEVFQFLQTLAGSCAAGPPSGHALETQKQILVCLERWIDNADIPLNAVLLPSGIFSYALDALSQTSLLEEASGVMIVVMRRYPYSPHSKDIALISALLPRIMAVRGLWTVEMNQSGGPSVDICRSIARLFTETMESYIELYLSPADYGQQHLLQQLLDCARFNDDFDVTRIPLRAFYELSNSLKELSHEMSTAEYEGLRGSVAPYFLELLSVAVQQLKLDDSTLRGEKLDSDEQAERDEWRETVLDICEVVGAVACVERICTVVQAELSKANGGEQAVSWGVIESCLFAIQVVGGRLPANENVFLPQILGLCSACPQILLLHVSILQLFGNAAHWISCNRKYLSSIFEQLLGMLSVPTLSLPAAVALLKLCKHCSLRDGGPPEEQLPLDKLFQALLKLRATGTIELETDTTILEGLTYILTDMPPLEAAEGLKSIIQPTAESLTAHLSKGSPIQLVLNDVERATVLFRYTSVRRDVYTEVHPVTSVFVLMWPLLMQTMQTYKTESCYEKICRCYKYVIKSSGRYFLPHLNSMAEHIVQQFSVQPLACFLYVAAVCFGEFGALGARHCLSNVYVYMSKMFFDKYRTVEDFSHSPDLCEEYFFLSARVLQFFPEILLGSDAEANHRLQVVVQAGLSGLKVQHRETVKGILTMFGEIIN